MKIMVIGGNNGNERIEFESLCKSIALTLIKLNATLVICSLFEDSADYLVFKEYSKKSSSVELHFFDNNDVQERIERVLNSNYNIKLIPYLDCNSKLDIRDAYLFCQINAIKQVDAIIAIGGKENGSANLLLHIAEINKKMVIPFIKYKGASENYYVRNKYKLMDLLGDKYILLFTNNQEEIIRSFLNERGKDSINDNDVKYVFLSYPRDNPSWADYIEVILRRRGISMFRDESEFKAGSDIPNIIQEEIYKADTFIAVWCKEYACSPWCIDELEMALERKKKINLWILCVDNTRIVPRGARNLLNYKVRNREELEGVLLKLLTQNNS